MKITSLKLKDLLSLTANFWSHLLCPNSLYLRKPKFNVMKQNVNFAKSFLSICLGIAVVMCSLSLFMFSTSSSYAEIPVNSTPNALPPLQVGTAENFIAPTIHDGYAYWIVFNVADGYKFRRSPVAGGHWGTRTE